MIRLVGKRRHGRGNGRGTQLAQEERLLHRVPAQTESLENA